MWPHGQNAWRRCFVVPTNNALHSESASLALLLFWPFTLPVLHSLSPFFQHTSCRGFVPLKASPSIGVDGEHQ
jgi:hypothetical protein